MNKNIEQKKTPLLERVGMAGKVLQDACHGRAHNAGWWHDPATGARLNRNVPAIISDGGYIMKDIDGVTRIVPAEQMDELIKKLEFKFVGLTIDQMRKLKMHYETTTGQQAKNI